MDHHWGTMDEAWGTKKRLEISHEVALTNAIKQMKKLQGKELYALQSEWHEWMVSDFNELEVQWVNHWDEWRLIN